MKRMLFRNLFGPLVVCLALPGGAGAAQSDPFHKEGRGKLSYELDRIARDVERGGQVRTTSRAYNRAKGTVTVVIELRAGASPRGVSTVVQAAGGRVEGAAGNLVKATLAPGALREVAAHPDVRLVRTPFRPNQKKAAPASRTRSDIISQGVAVINADAYIARTGADGSGVTVGVLDGQFQGVAGLLGGELPGDLSGTDFVLSHLDSFQDVHGTACAEIVHDVAPGAKIAIGAFEDEVGWANQIDELIDKGGARIISHSIGFDNLFPPDGNNLFTRKVDEASARGVLFVTAAGNEGENYFQGRWADLNGNGFLDFGPNTELLGVFMGSPGSSVALRWDDAFAAANHDYDLAIVTPEFANNSDWSESNPAIVAVSADVQNGSGDPVERLDITVAEPGLLFVVIRHDPSTPVNPNQRFFFWAKDGVDPAFANASGTLSMPGDARGAVTVGAVAFDSRGLEGYSSRGPTADGRVKPDVVGPDRVVTVSYGEAFPGTSAATPHVAGAAALILSRNPALDVTTLRMALERATTSGGSTTAKNNDVGFGLIDLNKAP